VMSSHCNRRKCNADNQCDRREYTTQGMLHFSCSVRGR
jgi:hypothetical protein